MSILKQSHETLSENKKQTNSFGNWFSFPLDKLTIIILTDNLMADASALQMLKSLAEEVSTSFPDLPINPNSKINRSEMENIVRALSETYGKAEGKILQAKQKLAETTSVMRNNIGNMMENSNKLEDIESSSNNMRSAAQMFSTKGRLLEEKMKRRNRMLMLALGAIALFFIVLIIMYFS